MVMCFESPNLWGTEAGYKIKAWEVSEQGTGSGGSDPPDAPPSSSS